MKKNVIFYHYFLNICRLKSFVTNMYVRIIISLILCFSLFAQGEAQDFEPLINNIRSYNIKSPQELVFIDCNVRNGCYIGDTIHFSAHVVKADSLCPSSMSGILYVELINPQNKIVDMRKVRIDSLGMAEGSVVVDSLLDSGFYTLRAYTRYQTNWPSSRYAYRVVPVYYPECWLREKLVRKNRGVGFINLDHSSMKRGMRKKGVHSFFSFESGGFTNPIPTRMIVHAVDDDGMPLEGAEYKLYNMHNDVVSRCRLDRFGNALMECPPLRIRQSKIVAKTRDGKHKYPVASKSPTGVVMRVDRHGSDVKLTLGCTQENADSAFCFIIMNRGNLLLDSIITIPLDTMKKYSSSSMTVSESKLGRGVNEFIVFDKEGREMARRRLFVGNICNEEEQWLLLESELLGRYVLPHDAYKTLTADEIDRILLSDNAQVFPWWTMASMPMVQMRQPSEKQLMVFGRAVPRIANHANDLESIDGKSFTLTLSQGRNGYKSKIVCDCYGYFGSYFPDLKGEWMLMAHHNDELSRHDVLIFENFSPRFRGLSKLDCRPEMFGKSRWLNPDLKRYETFYYDCDEYTKNRMANGGISLSFYNWLGQQNRNLKKMKGVVSPVIVNVLRDSAFNKHLDYNFLGTSSDDARTVAVDGPTYNGRPIVWIIDGQYRMVTGLNKMITDFHVLRPCRRHMPNFVDEVKNVFITEDPSAFHSYVRCSVLEDNKPVTIFITLHKNYIWNDAGLVTAPFQGISSE